MMIETGRGSEQQVREEEDELVTALALRPRRPSTAAGDGGCHAAAICHITRAVQRTADSRWV